MAGQHPSSPQHAAESMDAGRISIQEDRYLMSPTISIHRDSSPRISVSTVSRVSLDDGGNPIPSVSTDNEDNESPRRSRSASPVGSNGLTAHQPFIGFPAGPIGLAGQSIAYQPLPNPSSSAQPNSENAPSSISGTTIGGTFPQKAPKSPISWWWWWEIGSGLLSIISMVLLLVTLLKANNLALASWTLWIQPNSLIAVFTTVGKSAMMVPIASCISQLKWRHFLLRPNRLSHLQVIDEASRGPWGSLMVLLNVRVHAFTVWSLAIVSIVALGYDPSAQQILSFPARDTKLTNVTADIGMTTQYWSKAYLQDNDGSTGSKCRETY